MALLLFTLIILVYFIIETIYRDYFKYKRENVLTINKIEHFLEDKAVQIKELSEDLTKKFNCRLCSSSKLDTNVISISGKEYSHLSKKRPHKFLKATCMECGSSSFYNLNQIWGPDELDPLPLDKTIYQRFMGMADLFTCRECSSKQAISKIITARKRGFRHWFRSQPSEFICLSCKHCGLSYFFDTELMPKESKDYART